MNFIMEITFLLEWPGIGELNYNVINTTIVPATYELNAWKVEISIFNYL